MINFKKLILDYQRNLIDFEAVYNFFSKYICDLVKKYQLQVDKSDLMVKLWNLASTIDVTRFETDEKIYYYILKSLKYTALNLLNKQINYNKILFNSDVVDIEIANGNSYSDFDDFALNFNNIIKILPEKQKKIIFLRYYDGLSDEKIATLLGQSRQSIHKSRVSALSILKSDSSYLMG